MKRKLFLTITLIMVLFPVFFAFRSQSIFYWLTGPDYRIKESIHQLGETALANSDGLISLDFIETDLSRLPFVLNLEGRHLYGGKDFSINFFPGGAIITNSEQRVGVINNDGEVMIPFEYDRIIYSDETFMASRSGQPTIYYNQLGQPLFQTAQAVQTPFSGGLVYLSNGVHNKSGALIFTPEAPILSGFEQGLGSAMTGSEIIIYQDDGTVRARLKYPNIYDLTEGYALVGDDNLRFLVDFEGTIIMRFEYMSEGLFDARRADGTRISDATYDDIELLNDQRIVLRNRLTYTYYDHTGKALLSPELNLAEQFQDGYSLSSNRGEVRIYQENGRLVKTIPGEYVPDTLSEGTLVVTRADLNGEASQYLYSVKGKQLTYRPMTRIMPRYLGISVVFDTELGVAYLRDEPATQWVFVPSQLMVGATYAFPVGLVLMLVIYLFIRRYKL